MHGLLAVPDLGADGDLEHLGPLTRAFLENAKNQMAFEFSDTKGRKPTVQSSKMVVAPAITLYTNRLHASREDVISAFGSAGLITQVVSEEELHQSLFISYGGPDEGIATEINAFLKARGVKTWFFPDDALPGQKLHRMMHQGINAHDRILLICSKSSLSRSGVLNELERVLEKEAELGGADLLIPVTVDDHVFSEWLPERPDVAKQVRSRVITTIPKPDGDRVAFDAAMSKVVAALKK
ncbi:toll/interleukin-1 receptor domain-containing protein [Paraburkholderia sp. UYCP14C]|uniref:toll/interleukin-1 receptor domain-containing protein n=1 Tax=Paraburkholderia sp. UYCP14C TaxID=2511130 RepID=UPI00145A0307|nr:toll/interleukin-1 receptor domain-containing protein [Paraburkholderia sp. UYCP14C]